MNGVLLQDALLALLILSIFCALLNQGMRVYEKASQIGIEAIDTQWFYDDGGAVGAAGCERLPASGDGVFAGGAKACRRAGRHPARIHDFVAQATTLEVESERIELVVRHERFTIEQDGSRLVKRGGYEILDEQVETVRFWEEGEAVFVEIDGRRFQIA